MKKVQIAFVCDDGYVMQTSVAIVSAIQNKKPESAYVIHVIGTGLSSGSVSVLQSLETEGVEIRVLRAEVCPELHDVAECESIYRVATKAALLKFELPVLLDADRVLYLDGDLLVEDDLTELFSTELGDHYAAVVRDLPQVLFDEPLIDTGSGREYFNSGVMLLNLRQLRRENVRQRLADTKRASRDDLLMDQNIFNIVFAGRVIQLPVKYNVLYANLHRSWKRQKVAGRLNQVYHTAYRRPQDVLEGAAVIHYSSKDKPWKYYDAPLAKRWYGYYLQSPYGGTALKRTSLLKHRLTAAAGRAAGKIAGK